MLTEYVHPRLGLGKFKTFEPFFLEGLRNLPDSTHFDITGGLSPNTVIARMRDSMIGYRRNRWPQATDEFRTLFERHDGRFVFRMTDDMKVYMAPRQLPGRKGEMSLNRAEGFLGKYIKTTKIVNDLATQQAIVHVVRISGIPSTKEIATLATMKASGAIGDPIVFSGDIRSEATAEIEASADVVFHFDQDRNETILM